MHDFTTTDVTRTRIVSHEEIEHDLDSILSPEPEPWYIRFWLRLLAFLIGYNPDATEEPR